MSGAPALARGYQLVIGEKTVPQISVVRSPYLSLRPVMLAAAGLRTAAPWPLAQHVRKILPMSAGFALAPLVAAHLAGEECVDAFLPIPPYADVSVEAQIEHMRDAPDHLLLDELQRIYGDIVSRAWRPAAERPRIWFNSLAVATAHASTVFEMTWRAAAPAVDREIRRVGAALVRGGHHTLLNNLHPTVRFREGVLTVDVQLSRSSWLGGRRLVLVPLVATPHVVIANFDLPELAYLAYATSGMSMSAHDEAGDALGTLLGPLRAQALRLLAGPMTAGALASELDCTASTTTYHCERLETAGLIRRERRGQRVWITRTPRGDELIDLMAD